MPLDLGLAISTMLPLVENAYDSQCPLPDGFRRKQKFYFSARRSGGSSSITR